MKNSQKNKKNHLFSYGNRGIQGITILESLLVLAVLGVLVSIAVPQFYQIKENQLMGNTTSEILSVLNKARSNTLASLNSSEYGVHFQSDEVVIFKGKVFSNGAIENEVIPISAPISISNVTFGGTSGTSGDIYFNRLYGVPNTTGTVTVSSPSAVKIITISAAGIASLN